MKKLYISKDNFPKYYHPVTIWYHEENDSNVIKDKAWLAWDENYGYIWTLDNRNTWIPDILVIDWDF